MTFPNLEIKTEKLVLEKYLCGVNSRVAHQTLEMLKARHSDHALRQGYLYTDISPITDEMIIALRIYLLKSMTTEKKTLSIVVPATWFDHLKHDMLASKKVWQVWLVKALSPKVNMKVETKEFDAVIRVCPHNDSYMSEDNTHFNFLMWKDVHYGA